MENFMHSQNYFNYKKYVINARMIALPVARRKTMGTIVHIYGEIKQIQI